MALRDLKDAWGWIQRIVKRIERLESGAILERSSITDGVMTFIRGRLRLLEGAVLEIVGNVIGSGTFTWSGTMDQTGTTNLKGPWNFSGKGDITGDVDSTGVWNQDGDANFTEDVTIQKTLDVSAETTLRGVTKLLADLLVEAGGQVKVGGVTLTPLAGGRILIGTGSSRIILDTTQFKVGSAFRMDPTHSPTGAQMEFGPNRLGRIFGDDNSVVLTVMEGDAAAAALAVVESFAFTGIDILGELRASGLTPLPPGEGYDVVVRSRETDKFHLYAGAIGGGGGPGDGIFKWPFPLDQVTSEFRSAERPSHDGIDFGIGPSNTAGTPIPSMGAGIVKTILAEGQGHGWGNGVIIDHGTDPMYGNAQVDTLYAHMSTPPVVALGEAVALGQTLGPIGNTGNSFGNHLHLEVHVNGSPVNPRTFMAAHGG